MENIKDDPEAIELINYLAAGIAPKHIGMYRKFDFSEYPKTPATVYRTIFQLCVRCNVNQAITMLARVTAKYPDIIKVPTDVMNTAGLNKSHLQLLEAIANGKSVVQIAHERKLDRRVTKSPSSVPSMQQELRDLKKMFKAKNNLNLIYKVVKLGYLELKS